MQYKHSDVTQKTFEDRPETLHVMGWEVNYMSFSLPEHREKSPLIILGGTFQSFAAFYQDIKAYLPSMPVILVALPGQYNNRGKRDSQNLSFRDLAEIMNAFLDEHSLETVNLAGFSYGSLIAYQYAVYFENRLEQLILAGCSLELRHAMREMMQHMVDTLKDSEQSQFAEMMSQVLLNFNTREQTGSTSGVLNRLTDIIRQLTPSELTAYQANICRLLRENLPRRSFAVRTLILSAQHDHLILPSEALEVYKLFDNAEFIVIQNSDHMLPLQAPRLIQTALLQFLKGEDFSSPYILSGLEALAQAQERRQQIRYPVDGMEAVVSHPDGFSWVGFIEDINMDGCGLSLPEAQDIASECSGTWKLTIKNTDYVIPGFLHIHHGKASFVFYKPTFEMREALHRLVGFARVTDEKQVAVH